MLKQCVALIVHTVRPIFNTFTPTHLLLCKFKIQRVWRTYFQHADSRLRSFQRLYQIRFQRIRARIQGSASSVRQTWIHTCQLRHQTLARHNSTATDRTTCMLTVPCRAKRGSKSWPQIFAARMLSSAHTYVCLHELFFTNSRASRKQVIVCMHIDEHA
jgi:hypothetical protein